MTYAELARLWTRHQPQVAGFINSLVHDFHTVEELLQETGAEVFEHMARFDDSQPFLPWVLGVARNVVLKHQRTTSRDRHVFDQQVVENLAQAFQNLSDRSERLAQFLEACRRKLSRRSQEVCRLRYEGNLGREEIAQRQKMTAGAVKIALNRIREQLRVCIERQMSAEGLR